MNDPVPAPLFAPVPHRVAVRAGRWRPPAGLMAELAVGLAECTVGATPPRAVRTRLDPAAIPWAEGYRLTVEPEGATLVAREARGVFYGMMTLRQLVRQADRSGAIACLTIEDRPAFPVRGVMLDISRDRVPTMETLTGLIDLWAELKLNQVQLYTEHTFAYPSHRTVWEKASPLTREEAEELDRYCAERAIELVPNQNSFGHMERWLVHERYASLADATTSFRDPWGGLRTQATTLNPLDPRSIELVSGLYDELLPHFRSGSLNVGADEPIDLGHGRSRAACARKGIGRVYLEFLLQLYEQVSRRGRTMQFLGDVVLHHPELFRELPRDVVALDWGYEADHPFDRECRALAEAGLRFYVCPGTSSWNSLGGRWGNARSNIDAAVAAGLSAGAEGFLLTDWGDNGHWQQLPVSYPAWVYGAAASWNPEGAHRMDVEACLSRLVLEDPAVAGASGADGRGAGAGGMAGCGRSTRALMILEEVYDDGIRTLPNAGILAVLLLLQLQPYHAGCFEAYRGHEFERERARLKEVRRLLGQAQAEVGSTTAEELSFTADLMLHAARLGAARFATPHLRTAEIPAPVRGTLVEELESLIQRYRRLWAARSRPGGLEDSAGRMTALLDSYRER